MAPLATLPQYDMDYWPHNAKIIQVDSNHKVLGLTKKVDVAALADVKEFSRELLMAVQTRVPNATSKQNIIDDVAAENKRWADEKEAWSTSTNQLMHPRRFYANWVRSFLKMPLSPPTSATIAR